MGDDKHSNDAAKFKVVDDLSDLSSWRPFSPDEARPHKFRVKRVEGGKVAALPSWRNHTYGNWPLGKNPLDYIRAAEAEGRILRGYVALTDQGTVVAYKRVLEVVRLIGNAPPLNGNWGLYWWVDNSFTPVKSNSSNEDPF